jgi:hypothetical protein
MVYKAGVFVGSLSKDSINRTSFVSAPELAQPEASVQFPDGLSTDVGH